MVINTRDNVNQIRNLEYTGNNNAAKRLLSSVIHNCRHSIALYPILAHSMQTPINCGEK